MTDVNKLQYKILFAVTVAGKTARFAQAAMDRYRAVLDSYCAGTWFEQIREVEDFGCLEKSLRAARMGRYRILEQAFCRLAYSDLDLSTCSVADLETIPGIGPKTARFFMLWTRPDARCAALDVHVLRWMREMGNENVPRSTPQSRKQYARLESLFLQHADSYDMTPAELDRAIWLGANKSGIRK